MPFAASATTHPVLAFPAIDRPPGNSFRTSIGGDHAADLDSRPQLDPKVHQQPEAQHGGRPPTASRTRSGRTV
jgi:hypothetical protein